VKAKGKVDGSHNHQKEFGKFKNGKRNDKNKKSRAKVKEKGKTRLLNAINVVAQITLLRNAQLSNTVELYQRSLEEPNNAKRSYEAHLNDETNEATTLGTIPSDLELHKTIDNDDMDMENMIIEYNSNDVFGDPK
jgi:hypothetical protein